MSDQNNQLACATCESVTYEYMKSTIKMTFGYPAATNRLMEAPCVKSESVLSLKTRKHFIQKVGMDK